MRTWGYRIATVLLIAVFVYLCGATYFGWLLGNSAATTVQRDAIRHRTSARIGTHITGGGSHFGK